MPPRPFPLQLGIGTDICRVSRIWKAITRVPETDADPHFYRQRFLQRLFTNRELRSLELWWTREQQGLEGIGLERGPQTIFVQFLAGRWAAKEAAVKAVKPRKITFHDIEIMRNSLDGSPRAVILDPKSATTVANEESTAAVSEAAAAKDSTLEGINENHYRPPSSARDEQQEADWEESSGQQVQISISHDGDYATAVCLAPSMPMQGDVGGEAAARMA